MGKELIVDFGKFVFGQLAGRTIFEEAIMPVSYLLLREVCLAQKISLSSDFVISMLKRVIIHHNLQCFSIVQVYFNQRGLYCAIKDVLLHMYRIYQYSKR